MPPPRSTPGCGVSRAWVESPLQLLSVVEAHALGLLGRHTVVVPRADVASLAPSVAHLRSLDLPAGLSFAAPARACPGVGSGTWVIGDAFSGRVQRELLTQDPGQVVIVDDGDATLSLLQGLPTAGASLVRPRSTAPTRPVTGLPRRLLGRAAAARLLGAAAAGRLTIVTAYPVSERLRAAVEGTGAVLRQHRFAWLRSQPAPRSPQEGTVVLGSAMVADRLLRPGPYLDWVRDRAARAPVAYLPHRREGAGTVGVLQGAHGVRVYTPGIPAELSLRGLSSQAHVVTLPSSAATTLRCLFAGQGPTVAVDGIPDSWWTPHTTPTQRRQLGQAAEPMAAALAV